MRGSYLNDPCRSERGGEPDDEPKTHHTLWDKRLPELALILHMSCTGSSDPLPADELDQIIAHFEERLAHWRRPYHHGVAFDGAVYALVSAALAEGFEERERIRARGGRT